MSKLLLYCTKSKKQLFFDKIRQMFMFGLNGKNDKFNSLNGKIVAECDFEVEEIKKKCVDVFKYCYITDTLNEFELMNKTQLDGKSMNEYLQGKGYAIYIKNLHIFDKPRELNDYYKYINEPIINAPQNMMKVFSIKEYSRRYVENGYIYEVRGDDITDYVLISIRPEWMCKILNGEKTIEVRKKILKEMMKNGINNNSK